jgi:hypothetical protein
MVVFLSWSVYIGVLGKAKQAFGGSVSEEGAHGTR